MKNTNKHERLHLYLKQAKGFKGKIQLQQNMQKGLVYTAAGVAAMGLMPIEVHAQTLCGALVPTLTGETSYGAPGYDFDGDGVTDIFITMQYSATQFAVLDPGIDESNLYLFPMGNNILLTVPPYSTTTFPASLVAFSQPYLLVYRDYIVAFPLSGPGGGYGFVIVDTDPDPNEITVWGTDLNATMGSDVQIASTSLTECPVGTAVLPVELITFTARATTNSITLNWQTASEENNAGFEIERSADGKNFTSIAFERGIGTIAAEQNYAFEDKNVRTGQLYYYRLKQIDFDGAFEYSDIVQAQIEGKTIKTTFFPNPSNGSTRLELSAIDQGEVTINIYDASGKEILNTAYPIEKGENNIPLDLVGFPKGLYLSLIHI